LKPSLTKHIGCDIIDINPGVGIWSSKLHDILKPRTHILMENDVKKYSTYLQPLLEEEGSTYKLIPKLGTVWEHLENAMTPEYLPHQKKLEPNDPKFNQPNDTLLLVANLVHHPRKVFRGFPSLSMLVTYQLLSAARSHALFHKYGLVRMLLWIPDEEKIYLLPRHVHSIRKTAIEALVTCESIREIASSTEDSSRYLRDQTLAVESAVDVVKKMDDQGIVTPAHRQGDVETAARQMIAGGTHEGLTDLHRYKRTYSDRLEDLQRRFDNGELPMRLDPDPEDPSGTPKFNPEWEQLVRLSSKVRLHGKNTIAYDKLIDEYFEINRLYGELKSANPKTKSTQKAKKALDARKEAWVAEIEAMHTVTWHQFIVRFDSRRITTPYEKRDCEPLKAYSKEFYPSTKAALMDIQPKALWPSLAKNFPENYDVFEYIIGNMYASPTQSVKEAFIGLWPGAYEQLKDNCPSLTDVTKGGCFDLSLLTVRGLTMEMLHEIIEAWLKWPFKPTRFDLMKRSGSAVWDPDSVEEFDGTADF
jgi:transcription factor 1